MALAQDQAPQEAQQETGAGDAQALAQPVAPAPVLMSFEVWFASTGRPAHHAAGMKAFRSTGGARTRAGWDALFAEY